MNERNKRMNCKHERDHCAVICQHKSIQLSSSVNGQSSASGSTSSKSFPWIVLTRVPARLPTSHYLQVCTCSCLHLDAFVWLSSLSTSSARDLMPLVESGSNVIYIVSHPFLNPPILYLATFCMISCIRSV